MIFSVRVRLHDTTYILLIHEVCIILQLEIVATLYFGLNSRLDPRYRAVYKFDMWCADRFTRFDFLPVASNDNDDLLAIETPEKNLDYIRSLKWEMREENARDGLLLRSRRRRIGVSAHGDAFAPRPSRSSRRCRVGTGARRAARGRVGV